MQQAETPHQRLTQFMTEQGMRKTPERYAILDTVIQTKGHNSADQILAMMPSNFHVSRGTMYSTLALLVECGLAYSHQIDGITLYENACGNPAHHHYICTGCHKIWDLHDEALERAATQAKTPRFKKLRSNTYIYGICNICQAKLARLRKKLEREKQANMSREELRFARIDEELAKIAEWFR